jgi:hypothetical protein
MKPVHLRGDKDRVCMVGGDVLSEFLTVLNSGEKRKSISY